MKRFEKQVEEVQPFCCDEDEEALNPVIFVDDAIKLLETERMATVVKVVELFDNAVLDTDLTTDEVCAYRRACSDMLYFLGKRGL